MTDAELKAERQYRIAERAGILYGDRKLTSRELAYVLAMVAKEMKDYEKRDTGRSPTINNRKPYE